MDPNLKDNELQRTARVFNVQKYNVHDGPGIRTLVFFKGCPLRCKWCSNPEGLKFDYQLMLKKQVCINCGACVDVCPQKIHSIRNGKHFIRRDIKCIGCGKCEKVCLQRAIELIGKDRTISDLLEIINEDKDFYKMSGGGVTIGGGECTSQPESLNSLLQVCKMEGINTAIETCGYVNQSNLSKIKDNVDLFLFDLKHMDPIKHMELTGVNNEKIHLNLKFLLENGKNVKVRMPMLKEVNDSKEEIKAIVNFLKPYKYFKNFKGIDLLPYHKYGVGKYQQLDIDYPIKGDPSLSEDELDKIGAWIKEEKIPVNIVKH